MYLFMLIMFMSIYNLRIMFNNIVINSKIDLNFKTNTNKLT